MGTLVRTGRHGHIKKSGNWVVCDVAELTQEDKQRIAREDADIKRRREAFGLY